PLPKSSTLSPSGGERERGGASTDTTLHYPPRGCHFRTCAFKRLLSISRSQYQHLSFFSLPKLKGRGCTSLRCLLRTLASISSPHFQHRTIRICDGGLHTCGSAAFSS